MSRLLGSALSSELTDRLSGRELEKRSAQVIQLLTVDAAGWPHVALLSYFEVVAVDPARIRLATYATSTTSANLRRSGLATLVIVDERLACYVKVRATELTPGMTTAGWNAAFDCTIEQVLVDDVDEAYEPGAYVAGGITYFDPNRATQLVRARSLLAELRER